MLPVEDGAHPCSKVGEVREPPVSTRGLNGSELCVLDVLTPYERLEALPSYLGGKARHPSTDGESVERSLSIQFAPVLIADYDVLPDTSGAPRGENGCAEV